MRRRAARVERLLWPISFAYRLWWNDQPVIIVANGPGPKLAGEAVDIAERQEKVDGLVSIGFCGALSPALRPSDIFVATEIAGVGPAALPAAMRPGYKTGKLLSINRVACTAAEKSDLRKSGADAVEMEAAAVAQRAQDRRLPFYAIRVVTDTADECLPLDFNQMRDRQGRFDRGMILRAGLCRPSAIPGLIQLGRRSKAAAEVLGDFIADARF